MATVTVRNVGEATKRALQHRAVRRGVSMEQEIRTILEEAARGGNTTANREESLYEAIRRLVEPHGGFELELPPREAIWDPFDTA